MPTLHFYKDERSEDEVIQNKTAEISAVLLFIFVVFYNTTYKLTGLRPSGISLVKKFYSLQGRENAVM